MKKFKQIKRYCENCGEEIDEEEYESNCGWCDECNFPDGWTE